MDTGKIAQKKRSNFSNIPLLPSQSLPGKEAGIRLLQGDKGAAASEPSAMGPASLGLALAHRAET